ncbi:MAG: BON domain-containing protein [Steroidobacteraceae bacterium]
MKSDDAIKRNVEAELGWNPELDASAIAVTVNKGVVALSGLAGSYADKHRAEATAKRLVGVTAVANDITVRLALGDVLPDPDIARSAVTALQLELPMEWQDIKVLVHDGRVALEGTVEWHHQRDWAESAVRRLRGVDSVRNSIRIEPRIAAAEIQAQIERAFKRIAHIDARDVVVDSAGSEVTLRGEVRSWAERDQAQQTAWSAPGVTHVKNELTVRT